MREKSRIIAYRRAEFRRQADANQLTPSRENPPQQRSQEIQDSLILTKLYGRLFAHHAKSGRVRFSPIREHTVEKLRYLPKRTTHVSSRITSDHLSSLDSTYRKGNRLDTHSHVAKSLVEAFASGNHTKATAAMHIMAKGIAVQSVLSAEKTILVIGTMEERRKETQQYLRSISQGGNDLDSSPAWMQKNDAATLALSTREAVHRVEHKVDNHMKASAKHESISAHGFEDSVIVGLSSVYAAFQRVTLLDQYASIPSIDRGTVLEQKQNTAEYLSAAIGLLPEGNIKTLLKERGKTLLEDDPHKQENNSLQAEQITISVEVETHIQRSRPDEDYQFKAPPPLVNKRRIPHFPFPVEKPTKYPLRQKLIHQGPEILPASPKQFQQYLLNRKLSS